MSAAAEAAWDEWRKTFRLGKAGPFERAIFLSGHEAAHRHAAVEAYIARYCLETGRRVDELLLVLRDGAWWLEPKPTLGEPFCDGGGI
jgi:hypothetical protein